MDPTLSAVADAPPTTLMERMAGRVVSRATLRIVTRVWLAVLIVGSLQPVRLGVTKSGMAHSALHWVAFGGAAILLFALSQTRRQEMVRACMIFLLGLTLEVLQYSMNRKYMEWSDVRDDGFAVLAAWAIWALCARGSSKPNTAAARV